MQTEKPVYLISANTELRSSLLEQLKLYGFAAHSFNDIHSAVKESSSDIPDAVIIDLPSRSQDAMFLAELKLLSDREIPVIVLSKDDTFDARLQAVRFGGDYYMIEPVDIHHLVSVLDTVTSPAYQESSGRVLLISDGPGEMETLQKNLEDRGFEVHLRNMPATVHTAISEIEPDLVILSLYYQDCLGMELAATIRQVSEFNGLPVLLFGSVETGVLTEEALQRGADEYIWSQRNPDRIALSLSLRIDRYRAVRDTMVRDSLTGLLNHTTTRRKLESEVLRCKKENRPFAFAMVDIDKFKFVNDTYGHMAGDRVIQNLGRMLRKRTPPECTIGRYGGEEFAIIIPDSVGSVEGFIDLLDRLRRDFAGLEHSFQGIDFRCTYSCGLAVFPEYSDAFLLNDAADQALYRAKEQGGNRVVLAQIT